MYMLLSYVLTLPQMFPQNAQTHKSTNLFKLMMLLTPGESQRVKEGGGSRRARVNWMWKVKGEKEIM